jgi:hypothetical protein
MPSTFLARAVTDPPLFLESGNERTFAEQSFATRNGLTTYCKPPCHPTRPPNQPKHQPNHRTDHTLGCSTHTHTHTLQTALQNLHPGHSTKPSSHWLPTLPQRVSHRRRSSLLHDQLPTKQAFRLRLLSNRLLRWVLHSTTTKQNAVASRAGHAGWFVPGL